MSLNQAEFDALIQAVEENLAALEAVMEESQASATTSSDAQKFNAKVLSQWMADVTNLLNSHMSASNPHNVTAAQANVYTKVLADAIMAAKIPLDRLPLSWWGNWQGTAAQVTYSASSWQLTITSTLPLFMAGRYWGNTQQVVVNLNSVDPTPANKTFNVYIQIISGVPSFIFTRGRLPISQTTMYLGTITTGASGVASHTISERARIGIYQGAGAAAGQSYPISDSTGALPASWNSP